MKNDFLKKMRSKEVITFDIFDTLVHRKLAAPTDLFDLVRAFLIDKDIMLDYHDIIINYPHLRRLSEEKARKKRAHSYGDEGEIIFDEIYIVFQELSHADDVIIDELKKIELELELLILYRSPAGYELYNLALKEGKKIFYISDMYLPSSFLKKILKKNGYTVNDDKQIYVSGEHRFTKHTGKLFEHFLEEQNIKADSCLHVGDNVHSDIKQANNVGIKTIHADWSSVDNRYIPFKGHFNDYIARSIVKHIRLPQHNDFLPLESYEKLGYQIWGPLLFGYMIWLVNELKSENVDTALFFARDANFILELYNIFFKDHTPNIATEYVYLSRASLIPLSLTDWQMHRLYAPFGGKSKRTVKEAFDFLNLDARLYMDDIRQVGFESIDELITDEYHEQMHHLINKLFKPIMENSQTLREDYQEYFQNFVKNSSKIALIDIGWAGNMQATFLRILGNDWVNKEYIGLYFGTFHAAHLNVSPYTSFRGWLTSNGEPRELEDMMTRNAGVELMEFALTTNHGSTLGYKKNDNTIEPILEELENETEYQEKALSVQKGIKKFFEDYKFLLENISLDALLSKEWATSFTELVKNPTEDQIKLLATLSHSDTAGKNSKRMLLAQEVSDEAKREKNEEYRNAYEKAYWKSAFIKLNEI